MYVFNMYMGPRLFFCARFPSVYLGDHVHNYCNDALQVLMVSSMLPLSVVQLVHQLVDQIMHMTIPY